MNVETKKVVIHEPVRDRMVFICALRRWFPYTKAAFHEGQNTHKKRVPIRAKSPDVREM